MEDERIHKTVIRSVWKFLTWSQDDVPYLTHSSNLLDTLDKLEEELLSRPGTTPHPIAECTVQNILPTVSLIEVARMFVGLGADKTLHHAIGTGTTEPDLDDTGLQTEVARKAVASIGNITNTGRLASTFYPTDISSLGAGQTVNITESAVMTAAAGGTCMLRVLGDPQPVSAGRLAVIATNITVINGTEEE